MSAASTSSAGTWRAVGTSDIAPRKRSMHSASMVGERMLVFGGHTGTATNDLWELDIGSGEWELKEPAGLAPSERTYHSSVAHDGRLVVFGGAPSFPSFAKWGMGAGAPTALNDVHVYSIEACSWERPKLQSVPSGRHGHSAVVAGNSMLVFGGYSSASHNDMWRLDLIDFHWHALAPKGAPPCPRWRHTAVVTDAGGMYVFGGNTRGSESENLNDMYCYDIERNQWSQVGCGGGERPSPRHDHSLVRHASGLVLFGGNEGGRKELQLVNDVHLFDVRTDQWHRVPTCLAPVARAAHTAVATAAGGVCVFGGDDKDNKLSDAHVLQL